ncbi:MAG: hypothetical protein R3272_06665 [Candidatus Promineifilaceae bacterium]|nr:hypothetical protein [Candidatus Promineifilaceae bacterium]
MNPSHSPRATAPAISSAARGYLQRVLQLHAGILIGVALIVFLAYFAIYTHYAVSLFRFPFDYDQGEGFELLDTILFSQGEWPYRDITHYPFYSSNYPPLFHLVVVPLVWIFGPQYWTGRVVAYASTLVTATVIGLAVYRGDSGRGRGRLWLATLSGLAFLASNYIYHVGPLFRQHIFMVMVEALAILALVVVTEREEKEGRRSSRGLLLVMLLLLAAGYTKQLAYATVATVFIFLFLRRPRRAVLWAVPFALATAAIFAGINLATDGHWLINTVTANVNPFIMEQMVMFSRQWFQLHMLLAVVAAAYALYQLYFERLSAYSIWFAVALLNSVTVGKWGAGESYFATAIAASCILTGLAFARLLSWTAARSRMQHLVALVVIPLLFLWQANRMFHMPTHTPLLQSVAAALGRPTETPVRPQTGCSAPRPAKSVPYVDSAGVGLVGRPPDAADREAGIAIVRHILRSDTPAFSDEAGFNLYAGREVVTNPTQLLNLHRNGAVDLTPIIATLEAQAFDTVVLRAQLYPDPILRAIEEYYKTVDLIEMNGFVYCILEPRE